MCFCVVDADALAAQFAFEALDYSSEFLVGYFLDFVHWFVHWFSPRFCEYRVLYL